jgi:hypothetical protein
VNRADTVVSKHFAQRSQEDRGERRERAVHVLGPPQRMGAELEESQDTSWGERREGMMAIGSMWNYHMVHLSGVPE